MFNKDVKVPLQEAELVGTSSSNTCGLVIFDCKKLSLPLHLFSGHKNLASSLICCGLTPQIIQQSGYKKSTLLAKRGARIALETQFSAYQFPFFPSACTKIVISTIIWHASCWQGICDFLSSIGNSPAFHHNSFLPPPGRQLH